MAPEYILLAAGFFLLCVLSLHYLQKYVNARDQKAQDQAQQKHLQQLQSKWNEISLEFGMPAAEKFREQNGNFPIPIMGD